MKTLMTLLIILVLFGYSAGINISIRPFKISFETPYTAIGVLFLALAIGFFEYQSKLKYKKQGKDEIIELLKEMGEQSK